jgi:hypothetical protein
LLSGFWSAVLGACVMLASVSAAYIAGDV